MTDLQQYIKLYFSVSASEIITISELFKNVELKKGDFFVKQQQYCKKLSFVKSGYVRFYATLNDKEVTQWVASQGHFLTDLQSLIFDQRCRWNMQALTDCELFTINEEDYKKLNELVPNWSEIEKQFIAKCFITLEERVFQHLSLNTEERYQLFYDNNAGMFNQVPLQYIASMLGMTPETLSRIRKKQIS